MNIHEHRAEQFSNVSIDEDLQAFMSGVYSKMSIALGLTGVIGWFLGNALLEAMQTAASEKIGAGTTGLLHAIYGTPLYFVFLFAPLLLLFAFSAIPARHAASVLYLIAAVNGIALAPIVTIYQTLSLLSVALATAGAFAGLSIYGYTTKRDLSGLGSFMMMGLIGLIIASIVNIFMNSGPLSFAIAVIGVLIFAGLTVYDTQKIKARYIERRQKGGAKEAMRMSAYGALTLYYDALNLFLELLRIFGDRR